MDKDNQRLQMRIRDSYSLSAGVYGYRRVHGDLIEIGEICGKNRVSRLMQLNCIKAALQVIYIQDKLKRRRRQHFF